MDVADRGQRLHLNGKYSDLKVTCKYREWSVHKAIVCSRSGFFDGACSHRFREAETGVIDLSEDDEDAVEQMIHCEFCIQSHRQFLTLFADFYHLDYLRQPFGQEASGASAMFRHRAYSDARRRTPQKIDFSQIEDPLLSQAGLYTSQDTSSSVGSPSSKVHSHPDKSPRSPTAHSSDTPPLDFDEGSDEEDYETTESESHLILHTQVRGDPFPDPPKADHVDFPQVYALAEKYDIPALKSLAKRKFEVAIACYYDAPELAEAIERVYASTIDSDRGLREVVLQLFKLHPQLANTQDIFEVIRETPTLALDLWKVERGLL